MYGSRNLWDGRANYMKKHAWVRQVAVGFLTTSLGLLATSAAAAETSSVQTYPGYTQPSEQRKLNFNGPGVVVKVHVKEGDYVKAGTLVAEQDARVEEEHLKGVQIQAHSDLQIIAADKTLAEKKVVLERKTNMLDKMVGGKLEVLEAQLDVDIAEARLQLSKEEKAEKQAEEAEEQAKIAQKKLYATTDGIVQQIGVHEGELASNDPKNAVVSMVTNEPLYVDVNLPLAATKNMDVKTHPKLEVQYEGEKEWHTAEVIFLDPVAMPGTRQQKTRLQMDNPSHYHSGMNVLVRFPEPLAAAQPAR